MFPDWSHFDHPGMVGWLGQLFTLNGRLDVDGLLRLPAVIAGTANTWLMYRIGMRIAGERVGFVAALMYTASIYGSFLTGLFFMPDAPQSFFWLASLALALDLFQRNEQPFWPWALLGMSLAGALLSKYHSVFLLAGLTGYVLFYRRDLLGHRGPWACLVIASLGLVPTVLWNIEHEFISFAFHSGRVNPSEGININTFFQEIGGEFAYNNPIVFVLCWAGVISALLRRKLIRPVYAQTLLLVALPLLITFIGFSLFRRTLPHWTGPAYLTLIPLGAAWVTDKANRRIPRLVTVAVGLVAVVAALGLVHIQTGFLTPGQTVDDAKKDVTLDMYGWRDAGEGFREWLESTDQAPQQVVLIGSGWFPTAHYDRYVATPVGAKTCAFGSLQHIHKYAWIHNLRGMPKPEETFFYVTDSRNYKSPKDALGGKWAGAQRVLSIPITRGGNVVKTVDFFKLDPFDPTALTRSRK